MKDIILTMTTSDEKRTLSEILDGSDRFIISADNLEHASALIARELPRFVLLDLSLPDTEEFLARITYMLNKDKKSPRTESYCNGRIIIDFDKRLIIKNGEEVHLTQNEFRVIDFLSKNAGKTMSHSEIIDKVWGANITGDNKILRVNMTNVRKKVELDASKPSFIHTVFGVGYRMAEKDAVSETSD
ncbi:MAG: response regulator transcription factor [Oscillospiraceae bacterium]|nr:response regulator transcription factor [Oscillospiraceae bacterium]